MKTSRPKKIMGFRPNLSDNSPMGICSKAWDRPYIPSARPIRNGVARDMSSPSNGKTGKSINRPSMRTIYNRAMEMVALNSCLSIQGLTTSRITYKIPPSRRCGLPDRAVCLKLVGVAKIRHFTVLSQQADAIDDSKLSLIFHENRRLDYVRKLTHRTSICAINQSKRSILLRS